MSEAWPLAPIKKPNKLVRFWMRLKARWYWFRAPKDEKERIRAHIKILQNVLANAPMAKIAAGESCSWEMTPTQEKGAKEGVQEYVKAVTGEDVQMAERSVSTQNA